MARQIVSPYDSNPLHLLEFLALNPFLSCSGLSERRYYQNLSLVMI
jgi:hypothetical protein